MPGLVLRTGGYGNTLPPPLTVIRQEQGAAGEVSSDCQHGL